MVAVMVGCLSTLEPRRDETDLRARRQSGLQDILTWITSSEKRKKAG
jgi:hypothetical protein